MDTRSADELDSPHSVSQPLTHAQWCGRFVTAIMEVGKAPIRAACYELENRTSDDDDEWEGQSPEAAAAEAMSYWEVS